MARPVQGTASIEGIVVKAGSNQPIQGATVELTGIAPRTTEGSSEINPGIITVSVREAETDGRVLSFTTTTGKDGKFSLRNVPATTGYQLIAIRTPDFLPSQYGQRVPAVPGRPIDLSSGQQLRDVLIEMTPSATIAGRVVDDAGQPVRNTVVELRRPWYLEGWRLLADSNEVVQRVRGVGKSNRAAAAQTNNKGEFQFDGLLPAHYYLRTSKTHDADARRIDLHAGDNITNVRIVMQQSLPHRLRGTVVMSGSGQSLDSGTISLVRRDEVPLYQNAVTSATAVKDGRFELVVRETGDYFLLATGRDRQGLRHGRKAIRVGDSDIDGVRIELEPAFDILGSVTTDGSANRPLAPMSLALFPSTAGSPRIDAVDLPFPRGTFRLRNVTVGDFRLEIQPILRVPPSSLVEASLENAYVKSIKLGNADVLNDGFRIQSVRDNSSLEVVISMRGGMLEGRILDSDKMPASNSTVVLVPETSRRQRGDLYKNVYADDSGHYRLTGIAPGNYKLFAWERVEDGAWQDPDFIKLYENRGASVRVQEDQHGAMDTTLIRAWN